MNFRIFTTKLGFFGGGMGMGGPRKPVSLLLGLLFLALGVVPLLNQFNVIGFKIPLIPGIIIYGISVVGAVFLLWNALAEGMSAGMGISGMLRPATFIVALVLLAVGLVPLLNSFKVIDFVLPELGAIVLAILYSLTGLLLLYGGTQGM